MNPKLFNIASDPEYTVSSIDMFQSAMDQLVKNIYEWLTEIGDKNELGENTQLKSFEEYFFGQSALSSINKLKSQFVSTSALSNEELIKSVLNPLSKLIDNQFDFKSASKKLDIEELIGKLKNIRYAW